MLCYSKGTDKNRNPRWRTAAILDLLHHHIGQPTKLLLGHISLSNFVLIWCIDMMIWIFCRFGLKCLFTPLNFGFWASEPLNVTGHHRDPKRHILSRNRTYMPILVQIGSLVRPVREMKELKKARKETYNGKLGVRPDHPRWRSDMWSYMPGGLPEVVISFKFRQNRFRDVGGGSKFAIFPIPKASGLYNSLYYRTSRDWFAILYWSAAKHYVNCTLLYWHCRVYEITAPTGKRTYPASCTGNDWRRQKQ